jgi:UDP-N-acetylglucosamine--dolichyl-phosphate N-acetylglucosaminephosphotransferase
MDYLLLASVLVSFIVALVVLPSWISKCRKIDLVWEDMNKYGHPKNVASSGGIVVVMAFVLGVLFYIALKTFVYTGTNNALEIFSLLSVILILGIIGLTDDLLGWHNHGLPMKTRLILAAVAATPLMVISAGEHMMNLPFIGVVNFGIIYPLVLIPIGIIGASTTFNFLAGYNGLEAGQGILVLSFLSFVAYYVGSPWLSIVGLCMVGALVAFYIFNKYPAKVFPGDIMTYSIGALIAGMAILGNFEKIAVVVFIPYIIEVILKSRGRLKKHSFGVPDKKGNLSMPYDKIYGLEHAAIYVLNKFGRATERKVAYLIFAFQILFILIAFLML